MKRISTWAHAIGDASVPLFDLEINKHSTSTSDSKRKSSDLRWLACIIIKIDK